MAKTIEGLLNIYRQVEETRSSLELLRKVSPPLEAAGLGESPRLPVPAVLEASNGRPAAPLRVNVVQGGYQAKEGRLVLIINIEEADTNEPVLVEPLPTKMDILFDAEPKRALKANIPLSGLQEQFIEIELPEEIRSDSRWVRFDEQPLGEVTLPLRFLLHR